MNEIKELIVTHDEYLKIILFSAIAMLVITFIVHYFTERIRFPKYLPGVVSLVIGMLLLVSLLNHIYYKEYLGRVVVAMILIGNGVISLCFAMILGVFFKVEYEDESDDEDVIYEEY